MTEKWLAEDSAGAIAWAQSLPGGPSRDAAADMVAAQVVRQYPALALSLAAFISA